ncbi:hypothetical protein EDB85DRAFT_1925459, partial [Lactarius pseudohatsudake]
MGDILDSGEPLKPDILGLLHPRTPDDPKTVWEDVAVVIKVKDHSVKTVKQLATYARNHLSLNRRLALTLRFLCFHRSGVSASELLTLKEEDGFRSVVKHMVGILSIRDEAGFGLDSTRVNETYHLNGRYYDIVRTIQNRDSIRGRATAVIPEWPSRELTLVDEVPQLPEKMTKDHPPEGTLPSPHHLLNAQFWKVVDGSPVRSPEIKQLHCTAMGLEGLPLLDNSDNAAGIPTPAVLLETILHSMI